MISQNNSYTSSLDVRNLVQSIYDSDKQYVMELKSLQCFLKSSHRLAYTIYNLIQLHQLPDYLKNPQARGRWVIQADKYYTEYIDLFKYDPNQLPEVNFLLKRPFARISLLANAFKKLTLLEKNVQNEHRIFEDEVLEEKHTLFKDYNRLCERIFSKAVHLARQKVETQLKNLDMNLFFFNKVLSFDSLQPVSANFDKDLIVTRSNFTFSLHHNYGVKWTPCEVEALLLKSAFENELDSLVLCYKEYPGRALIFPPFRKDTVPELQPFVISKPDSINLRYSVAETGESEKDVTASDDEIDDANESKSSHSLGTIEYQEPKEEFSGDCDDLEDSENTLPSATTKTNVSVVNISSDSNSNPEESLPNSGNQALMLRSSRSASDSTLYSYLPSISLPESQSQTTLQLPMEDEEVILKTLSIVSKWQDSKWQRFSASHMLIKVSVKKSNSIGFVECSLGALNFKFAITKNTSIRRGTAVDVEIGSVNCEPKCEALSRPSTLMFRFYNSFEAEEFALNTDASRRDITSKVLAASNDLKSNGIFINRSLNSSTSTLDKYISGAPSVITFTSTFVPPKLSKQA
ncbi:uncharacterized protein SAPINGB_P005664 [Magnusiomyces paraingens]|uniref:DH domain-containing protein n=1 Tax=Magnusiomyces paraingens TaxID=2606893 RepID=A0A5E8C377_9ASCO|nr:uncharacterized protein SAPINGB_P005664 [Saprochaete ingens]VVT57375.1 unnamed protein product [Saprochaete ingens]